MAVLSKNSTFQDVLQDVDKHLTTTAKLNGKHLAVSAEEIFEDLITEGQVIPGESECFEDGREIPWLDMDLAQSGQEYFAKNYTAIIFAHGLYFGLGFGFKPVTSTIIRTRGFHGIQQTTKRLLSTLYHVLRWYECDVIGCYSEGFKAISRVRKTHASLRKKSMLSMKKGTDWYLDEEEESKDDPILKALKNDLDFLDTSTFTNMDLTYNPIEPMSQFSLAVTQLGFLLPMLAHPEAFGLEGDPEGVAGFEHLWAVIGHLSGLEDRFNLPLHRPGREVYMRVWKEIYLPSFLVRDSKIVAIQNSYYYSSGNSYSFVPSMGPASSLYFFMKQSNLEEFKGDGLYKIIPRNEKIGILLMRLILWLMTVSIVFRNFANYVTRKMVEKVLENYNREQDQTNSDLTTLPKAMNWSQKYRTRSVPIVQKWKKAQRILDMMSTKRIRWMKNKLHK